MPSASSLEARLSSAMKQSANCILSVTGFRSTRRTKIVATIGPATCSEEMLEIMAVNGMNVARLNMCHGSHEWHSAVIERIRKLNKTKG